MSTPEPVTAADAAPPVAPAPPVTPAPPPPAKPKRRFGLIIGGVVAILAILASIPLIYSALTTVSTDDAYVNGHVTFVAARVPGQVTRVYVDDNNRVRKGQLLVQLDKEPYQVQVNIAQAAVEAAQTDLVAANAQAHAILGQMRSLRFSLEHAIEDVDNQIALLRAKVATLASQKAVLAKAQSDYDRALPLVKTGGISTDEVERRRENLLVAQAQIEEALDGVYEVRVALGLPPKPPDSDDLTEVPPDLDQTFSTVRQAQFSLLQAAAQIGYYQNSFDKTPQQMIADFYKQDPSGNLDVIYAHLLENAPAVKQAQAKLLEAQRNLDQALLNLRYCDVVSEIDGVVTRRDVNPGNNVIAGQGLMAVRSLTEIWIDANFKETQLADLRIGQPADLDVDMYGHHHIFKGRISGFEMGTGSTLALLPPENATGNFVKIVQRLPVRIEVVDYDPDKMPLFTGLSVTPRVHINEEPTGPNAGKVLQPDVSAPTPTFTPSLTAAPSTQP